MNAALNSLGPPNALKGAVSIWAALSLACLALSSLATTDCPAIERVAFAFLLTLPVFFLAKRGHFGRDIWVIPTIGAQVYLIWTFGLLPSLAAAQSPETGIYQYAPLSKMIGSLGFLMWFSAFALGVGEAPELQPISGSKIVIQTPIDPFSGFALLSSFLVWLVPFAGAASQGMLSSWGQQVKMEEVVGTSQGNQLLLYNAFIALFPLLAFWGWLRSQGRWRVVFLTLLGLSLVALVLYSNRRITLISCMVAVYFLHRQGRTVNWKALATLACVAGLMVGPLLWPLRMALQNPELLKNQGDIFSIAKESIGRYITDPEFRELTELASKENLQGGRFNYADTYLATVQWTSENGFHRSPSILFGPITMIPSMVLPGKNELASSLNIKRQFNELGITNEPDFPMTPMQEAYFQYGYLGVLLGGFLWGLFARLLVNQLPNAWGSFERMLIWTALLFGAMSFEGYFSMFLPMVREAVVLGLCLLGLHHVLRYLKTKDPHSETALFRHH